MCTEDLEWIDTWTPTYDLITIYDKCIHVRDERPLRDFNSPKVIVRNIPNVGSCDSAFLTYILDRWESLPAVVQFGKGSSVPDGYKGIGQPILDCPVRESDGCAFGQDHSDAPDYFNSLYFDDNGDCAFFGFSLDTYDFTFSNRGALAYHASGFENMGAWIDHAAQSSVPGASQLNRELYQDACCTLTWDGE